MLEVREDFPFLERLVNGKPIIYLDNAATTQKPKQVINRLVDLYSSGISNVHRAINFLADEVTQDFEDAREAIARFVGAQSSEIIFVYNATQALNIVSNTLYKKKKLHILTTTLEHHSNLLPWFECGEIEFVPWANNGDIDMDVLAESLKRKPDLLTIASASNFLGSLHPLQKIISMCKDFKVPVLVDASQSIAHRKYDLRELECEYFIFSGHKIYGPGGTGILYIRNDIIENVEPFFLGGSMIKEAHADGYVLNDIPHRFEAGTPNIDGFIGLASALEYLSKLDLDVISKYETELIGYAKEQLAKVKGLSLYGPLPGESCTPLVPFHIKGLDPHTITKVLANRANVIVRSGFLCAQPAHDQLGIGPTIRASFGVYNTKTEIDTMIEVLNGMTRVVR